MRENHEGDELELGLVSVNKACQTLDVSRATIYRLMDSGDLPWCKIAGVRRIKRADLRALVARGMRGGLEVVR